MTLANQITLSRIVLAFFLFLFTWMPHFWSHLLALAVFVVASFTDWVDGLIARKTGTISSFGAIADPIADKILVAGALMAFGVVPGLGIPLWAVFGILVPEFLVQGLRVLAALQKKVLAAQHWGKWKMGIQSVCVLFILLVLNLKAVWKSYPVFLHELPYYLTLLMLLVTWASGVFYLYRYRQILKQSW
ncbi:MAG: CDP-diacylglycerol--glycerol-3-phosphate 3-phosphatidyltransferase [Elusimicrobia bacterium]|nr:CDP-diacylglycerol--glycerol-3-phosphate 3-phosphatidyltransferase [Elusimicrobiota bacterium]